MCGIAGFLSRQSKFNQEDLHLMTNKLAHRGPDAEGYYFDGICGLGHRRLSVIDLSNSANQPMYSADQRYIIVYNGEVYNFQEIGAKISQEQSSKEFKFKTASDTEIILEAFACYGTEFVHQLNGMFAIAIYDKLSGDLYLFRDRVGIKPLVYYWDGKNIAFASEIKSLTCTNKIPQVLNKKSVNDFLHLGFIPAPNTIYENVYKLNPGFYLKLSSEGLEKIQYWNIHHKISNHVHYDKEEVLVKLSDLIMSSIQYQLKSDVPYGVFLSGGIDSSLVTAQASFLSNVKINTFSIGFEENIVNESKYAKAVAEFLETDHHEFIISHKDVINIIETSFDTYDEPNADSSVIPTLLVSKLAKEHVTVALSGEGADEMFFGYGSYKWAQRLSTPTYRLLKNPASEVFKHMSSRFQRIGKLLNTSESYNLRSHIFSQEQYFFTNNEITQLVNPPYNSSGYLNKLIENENECNEIIQNTNSRNSQQKRKLSAMEQQALFDISYYLPDDLLTKVDRASMHFALETRVPYLDHRVIEYALNIDPELKFNNNISKYILKEILYKYVPKQLFDRPKQGFSIPLNKWLKGELYYLIVDYLNPEIIKKAGIVKDKEVAKLIREYMSGKDYLFNRLWLLIVLHKWINDKKIVT
ncbi:MAG: asparagine synthase (glutamine-hydrolyzing) [Bacteroidia bacterium]